MCTLKILPAFAAFSVLPLGATPEQATTPGAVVDKMVTWDQGRKPLRLSDFLEVSRAGGPQ